MLADKSKPAVTEFYTGPTVKVNSKAEQTYENTKAFLTEGSHGQHDKYESYHCRSWQ